MFLLKLIKVEVIMRNLVFILIAFIAVVTFIRAFDTPEAEELGTIPRQQLELQTNN